ncbi:MAG: lactate dehydrogenase [Deltaproteobacteria bacterium]|nr:lactate dehydrogenase [Deltaproteobacteria bacterium]
MNILFAAPENTWGGFLHILRGAMPQHQVESTGKFEIDSLKGFDILIPTMSRVSREILQTSDRLKLIQQCGVGLEGVDRDAARELNIKVANVPSGASGNADSVAELGIYQMVGLARNFREMTRNLAERRVGSPLGGTLSGSKIGMVGMGDLARALVKRLKSFDARLAGISRSNCAGLAPELGLEWGGGPDSLKKLLQWSDYVVLCLPLSDETRHLMNRETFGFMNQQAFLINLSRGGLVDRDALEEALATGKIAGAGLDVFWEEPPDPNDPIFSYNVLATPHVGGTTHLSMEGIKRQVVDNILRLENSQELMYLHD